MILKLDIHGNPHVGLFIKFIGDSAIVSDRVENKICNKIAEQGLEIVKVNSSIVGPYILDFEDKLILSRGAPDELIKNLRKIADVILIEGKKNLIGNIFSLGENGIIYSGGADKELLDDLSKKTGLPIYKLNIPEYPVFGGLVKKYKNRALISQYIPEKFYEKIKEILGLERMIEGSVNFGSPYVKYGIELTDKLMIVGSKTTGHELIRIEEIFGEYFK